MQIVYAKQEPPKSWNHAIFLAGPTPRDSETPSWRPDAIKLLESMGYTGVVFIPEQEEGTWQGSYLDQVTWEERGLEMADRIVFWVPRNLVSMPAFTTNVEFGRYVQSGKAVLGFPGGAPGMRYLEWLGGQNDVPVLGSLKDTLKKAIEGFDTTVGGGIRRDGERYVPKALFETAMFQSWYEQLRAVGNRLDEAKVLWTFSIPKKPQLGIFSYILQVKVWIAEEGRWKENEWVFARTDIACVVLYRTPHDARGVMDVEVVVVKEFRSPARTTDGYTHELPGGSCEPSDDDAKVSAVREVYEETGILVGKNRLRHIGSRQAAGTLSSHVVHGYAVELSYEEMVQAKKVAAAEDTFGEEEDTERTYVEVFTVKDFLRREDTDWTTVGLIMAALAHTF